MKYYQLLVESQNRDATAYPNPYDFTMKLNNVFKNVKSIDIRDAVLPKIRNDDSYIYLAVKEVEKRQFIVPSNMGNGSDGGQQFSTAQEGLSNIEHSITRIPLPQSTPRGLKSLISNGSQHLIKCSIGKLDTISINLYSESGIQLEEQVKDLESAAEDPKSYSVATPSSDIIELSTDGRMTKAKITATGDSQLSSVSKNQYAIIFINSNKYYTLLEKVEGTGPYDITLTIPKADIDSLTASPSTFELSLKGKPLNVTQCSFLIGVYCEEMI